MRRLWGVTDLRSKATLHVKGVSSSDTLTYSNTVTRMGRQYFSFFPTLKTLKMRLKGKTMKFKKVNAITFFLKFGKTHPTLAFSFFNSFLKKRSKQRFYAYGFCKLSLITTFKSFFFWKPYNIYHWRGVRRLPTVMVRKDGKVSEYFK